MGGPYLYLLPDFPFMSKGKKAPFPDKGKVVDLARRRSSARGVSADVGRGRVIDFPRTRPIAVIDLLKKIDMPPELRERRDQESLYGHTLRSLPHILKEMEARAGPLPEKTSEKDLEFLERALEWSRRSRRLRP